MNLDPKTLDRIKKLLARATSSEPHEAALALEMAQKMMAEHNLTAAEVEVGVIVEEKLRSVASATKAKVWELRLFQGIANALGLDLLFIPGEMWETVEEVFGERIIQRSKRVTDSRMYASYAFVGAEVEAKLGQYAASVLQRQLQRARAKFTATLTNPVLYRADKTREIDAYCNAWVSKALSKVSKLDPHPGKRAAIQKHMAKYTGKTKTQMRHGGSSAAAEAGARDGEEAELNRPVEGHEERNARALAGHRLALGSGKGE